MQTTATPHANLLYLVVLYLQTFFPSISLWGLLNGNCYQFAPGGYIPESPESVYALTTGPILAFPVIHLFAYLLLVFG